VEMKRRNGSGQMIKGRKNEKKDAGIPILKFLCVNLSGFAGFSKFNLPLPVYLAGKGDWRAKKIYLSLPIFASCGTSPQGS